MTLLSAATRPYNRSTHQYSSIRQTYQKTKQPDLIMVSQSEALASNASLSNTKKSLTAVFVGATSGIGLATLQAFVKHVPNPTAIIVGRNKANFSPELANLHSINPNGSYTFLESDVSLLANIDAVCEQIKSSLQGKKINVLFLSQGYISFAGREPNADGLDNSVSLRYYGRVRFAQQLLPSLSSDARVISILAGGKEGKIFEDDMDLERNYGVGNAAAHFGSLMTLSWDHLAAENKDRSFVHIFPGLVSTGLLGRSAKGALGGFLRWVVEPLLSLFVSKPEETGERMLFVATDGKYAKGSWSLDWDGKGMEVDVLKGYRERGFAEKVWEHNQKMFERAAK